MIFRVLILGDFLGFLGVHFQGNMSKGWTHEISHSSGAHRLLEPSTSQASSACLKQRNCWPNGQMRAKWLRQWLETETLYPIQGNDDMFSSITWQNKAFFYLYFFEIILLDRGHHCKRSLLAYITRWVWSFGRSWLHWGRIVTLWPSAALGTSSSCQDSSPCGGGCGTTALWQQEACKKCFLIFHLRCRIMDESWMKILVW